MTVSKDAALSTGDKAGFAAACVMCCAVPMLVLGGALTVGAVLAGGVVVGAIATIAGLTYLVITRRVGASAPMIRHALFAAGGSAGVAGLWAASAARSEAATLLAGAIAALAAGALLALADARAHDLT